MSQSVRAILDRLEPVKDSIALRPLTENELNALEKQVGLAMPTAFRDYFAEVGLFQDLTLYGRSEYEVHSRAEDFVLMRKFLVENFGAAASKLFPFADDGAGNEIATAQVNGELRLYFADHETQYVTEIGLFSEWLSAVVETALRDPKASNDQKRWCVQFSFKTPQAEPIFEILRKFEPTTFGAWSEEEVMPSGVHVSEAPFTFGVQKLILTKSDSRHPWAHPNFSFSFDELATLLPSESLIRRLDIAFHDSNLDYKLVDYGLLVLKNAVDEANVEHGENSKVRGEKLKSRKRRWWKFW